MRTIKQTLLTAGATTLALAWAMPAAAQDAAPQNDASVLSQEIVVTAQKRNENVQDVGIAINAYSGEQLRALGIQKSADIASLSTAVGFQAMMAE